jgi:hypothetical protein
VTTPTITIETITPEKAAEYLGFNSNNRTPRMSRVELYAKAMADNDWRLTGEAIAFNGTALINGQHRLMACVQAGVPFTSVVVRGVDSDAYDYIDSGLGRTASDVVAHSKLTNDPTIAAAAAKLVIGYTTGTIHNSRALILMATRTAIKAEIETDPALYEAAAKAGRAAWNRGFNTSTFAAFYVLSHRYSPEHAAPFCEALLSGAGMDELDPRLTLRNQVLGPTRPRTNDVFLGLMIRAWNAWVAGEQRVQLKTWTRGTPFPRMTFGPQ